MTDEVDKRYIVIVTDAAHEAIREQARFIAVHQHSSQNAREWLERVWTCVDDLEVLPLRHPKAEGYEQLAYVVRRVVLDNHLILFTVDGVQRVVYIVGLRHGAQLPRPNDLPDEVPPLEY